MRILGIGVAFFLFTIVFLSLNASSEVHKFDNLTVGEGEIRTFTDDLIFLQGDMLIDGEVPSESMINISIFDLKGREVETLDRKSVV